MYCGGCSYTCKYVLGDTAIHVVCIVGYSYTCSMYCGGYSYTVSTCIVYCGGYSYTCSMYCGGYSYTCRMYCVLWGIQLYISYVLGDTVIHVVCIVGYSYACRMYCVLWGTQSYM